jgi:hypothetical protein
MKEAIYGKPQILETEQDFNRLPDSEKQNAYGELVEQLIRKRYSLSAELAILRQQNTKYVEFYDYNLYAEECKAKAKEILGIL